MAGLCGLAARRSTLTAALIVLICHTCHTCFAVDDDLATALLNPTHAGYVPVNVDTGSKLFYAYWEAQSPDQDFGSREVPILLWLQGGPGCASLFGALHELGPYSVNGSLDLVANPGAWNRRYGLLFIDNPVGTGFSIAGTDGIPEDEMEMAADLYAGLQGFFTNYTDLAQRPLFITGESYAGKYVPSIGHFILDLEQHYGLGRPPTLLTHTRALPQRALALGPPVFSLAGLAIGNGLTDPFRQVTTHADTAFYLGLIDEQQRLEAMVQQLEIVQLIVDEDWPAAHARRDELLGFIAQSGGIATMLDMRRERDYDADHAVDRYLNIPEVKDNLGVPQDLEFEGCSEHVGQVLGPDVMRSVDHLIPDLLANMPMLLYQGQFDAQDGPATSEGWIDALDWPGAFNFRVAKRKVWRVDDDPEAGPGSKPRRSLPPHALDLTDDEEPADDLFDDTERPAVSEEHPLPTGKLDRAHKTGRVAGYWRHHGPLTHVVVTGAGHMVPHDQPIMAQTMIEKWVTHASKSNGRLTESRDRA